ncbi:MAG TPA: hypothetical protein VH913_24400 [Hyphomicrobiaceae bacterium]
MRRGDVTTAKSLYARAARSEASALSFVVGSDKSRTIGITAVSAAALWYHAGDPKEAARVSHNALTLPGLPTFAAAELRALLQAIWNETAQREAGLSFVPGQVLVSVKGGQVITGGAPLDLIVNKVQAIQSLFYRTAEYLKALPLRKKGPPSKEIQEQCRPWIFQSVPGSYQFAVAVQKPAQTELFPSGAPEPDVLTEKFLAILKAAAEDPSEALKNEVQNEDYRLTFLKMARNLAPTGKVFSEMEIRGAGDRAAVVLSAASRRLFSETLKGPSTPVDAQIDQPNSLLLKGVLRALNLDKDWLEVSVDGKSQTVTGVGETVDDLIGPMVNREVNVRVKRGPRNSLVFIDIELDE